MALCLTRLLGGSLLATGLSVAGGAYPMWAHYGWSGPAACAVAASAVVLAAMASAAVIRALARGRPAKVVAQVYLGLGLPRMALCLGLTWPAARWVGAPVLPTLVWMCGLYLVVLLIEGWWLAAGLRSPRDLTPNA